MKTQTKEPHLKLPARDRKDVLQGLQTRHNKIRISSERGKQIINRYSMSMFGQLP